MAPTVHQNGTSTSGNAADKRPAATASTRNLEKKAELLCRVKYCNTLPDIPFDLKFLTYPFESERFIQYHPTSLERNYKYEILTEHDLGVTIDLINRDLYQSDPYAQLDPADEKLLEEDIHTPQDSMRSRYHAKSVSWLRRSEYISTEQTRFQPQTMEKVEAKVGFNMKKSFTEETLYMDREQQIKAIEKTFVDSKSTITKHYSKPNVTAVEVLPLYPDFKNWKYPCAQVIFDSDPAPIGKNVPSQLEEMSQAMIRGVMDDKGEQFVAYFLPTEDTLEKRRRDFTTDVLYVDDDEYEYKMAREYNWNVKSKASKGYLENYFLVVRNDGIYFNELETRVRLSKRRLKVGQPQNMTSLVVKHVPLTAEEYRMQRYRERGLELLSNVEGESDDGGGEMEDDSEQQQLQQSQQKSQQSQPSQQSQEQQSQQGGNKTRELATASQSSPQQQQQSQTESESRRSRSRSVSVTTNTTRQSRSRSRSPMSTRPNSRETSQSRPRTQSRSGGESASSSDEGSQNERRSASGSPHSQVSQRTANSRRSRTASRSRSRSRANSQAYSSKSGSSHSPSPSRSRSPNIQNGNDNNSQAPSPSRSRSGTPHSAATSGDGGAAGGDDGARSTHSPSRSVTGSPRSGSGSDSGSGEESGGGGDGGGGGSDSE